MIFNEKKKRLRMPPHFGLLFRHFLWVIAPQPPVTGGFPSQRPGTWSLDVFFDLRLNHRLSKQSQHYDGTVMVPHDLLTDVINPEMCIEVLITKCFLVILIAMMLVFLNSYLARPRIFAIQQPSEMISTTGMLGRSDEGDKQWGEEFICIAYV